MESVDPGWSGDRVLGNNFYLFQLKKKKKTENHEKYLYFDIPVQKSQQSHVNLRRLWFNRLGSGRTSSSSF